MCISTCISIHIRRWCRQPICCRSSSSKSVWIRRDSLPIWRSIRSVWTSTKWKSWCHSRRRQVQLHWDRKALPLMCPQLSTKYRDDVNPCVCRIVRRSATMWQPIRICWATRVWMRRQPIWLRSEKLSTPNASVRRTISCVACCSRRVIIANPWNRPLAQFVDNIVQNFLRNAAIAYRIGTNRSSIVTTFPNRLVRKAVTRDRIVLRTWNRGRCRIDCATASPIVQI